MKDNLMTKEQVMRAVNMETKALAHSETLIGTESFFGNVVTVADYGRAVATAAERLAAYAKMLSE